MITWDNSPPVTITKSLSASTLRRRPSWLYVSLCVCVTHRREYYTVTHPCSANDELSRVSVCPVMNIPMMNCLGLASVWWWTARGFLSVQWWTAQWWIVWGFCPVMNSPRVSVWWWTAWWWIICGFCLYSGELPECEFWRGSVHLVVNCLMVNSVGFLFVWWWIVWGFCLPGGELSGVSVCSLVNSLMVNCLGFLFVWWWTAQ